MLSLLLAGAANGSETDAGDCVGALTEVQNFDFAPTRDFTLIRDRFELIEQRAREQQLDGIEQRVLSGTELDIDVMLITQKQKLIDRETLSFPWRIPFTDTPDRKVRFTIKSEATLNAFIEFVIRDYFEVGSAANPLMNFLDSVGATKLAVVIDGWPYAKLINMEYIGLTNSKLVRNFKMFLGVGLRARRDDVQLMINGSDNSHWDVQDAGTFRKLVLNASPATLHDSKLLRRWEKDYLKDRYHLNLEPLDTYLKDVTQPIGAQLISMLGIQFEPFRRELVFAEDWPDTVAPEFVATAVGALKKLIEHDYVWIEPSRRECRGRWRTGGRPCGWISRVEFELEWPYNTANDEWMKYEWRMYKGKLVPVSLSTAIELAQKLR